MALSNKNFLLLGFAGLLAGIGFIFLVFFYWNGNSSSQKTISLQVNTKDKIEVNNFLPNSRSDKDVYFVAEAPNYLINFYSKTGNFTISLLDFTSEDVKVARNAAEQKLIEILNTDQSNLCKLVVTVTVPESYNSALSGQDYGLSFCPKGLPIPDDAPLNIDDTEIPDDEIR